MENMEEVKKFNRAIAYPFSVNNEYGKVGIHDISDVKLTESHPYERLLGALQLPRSSKWPTVRKHILEEQPFCSICGSDKNVIVHHVEPFHLNPKLELDLTNLIPLCEGHPGSYAEMNCHFIFGHLGNWKNFDPELLDVAKYLRRLFGKQDLKVLYPKAA